MTYEYAEYFKLLLICGHSEELWNYVDNALSEQENISDIILELSSIGNDDNEALSVINSYLQNADRFDINHDDIVFKLVVAFLKRQYDGNFMSLKELADLIYKISVSTEKQLDDPWYQMFMFGSFYDDAEAGYLSMDDYKREFDLFINGKESGVDYLDFPPVKKKKTIFQKISEKLKK